MAPSILYYVIMQRYSAKHVGVSDFLQQRTVYNINLVVAKLSVFLIDYLSFMLAHPSLFAKIHFKTSVISKSFSITYLCD